MKKWLMQSLLVSLFVFGYTSVLAQTTTIVTDIFVVEYSEHLEQPLKVTYTVLCPTGTAKRSGISWTTPKGVWTSDNEDYYNNEYDRGHLAPAAAFACSRQTLKKTFTYLNCALQHEGLNRGPWKELERLERDLAKLFEVNVVVEVVFETKVTRVPGGAAIPAGFRKTITFDNKIYTFYFPNTDVSGQDWSTFLVLN